MCVNQILPTRLLGFFIAALAVQPVLAQPPGMPTVVVAQVEQRVVAATQVFVGTVGPTKRATIGSALDGRVVEFPIEEGDRIEAGQKLAQLLTQTISHQLAAAEAELELRQQKLAELQNGSLPDEIEQARARMVAADARRRFAIARRRRVESLERLDRVISADELEEAIAASKEAEANYREAAAVHRLSVQGPRKELIAQAQAEVAMQQAAVDQLRDQISKHTIISRFPGYVVAEFTEIGQWVSRGGAVAEVVAIDEVEVTASVVENSVPFIQPGTEVPVEFPAIPDRTFRGEVLITIAQADPRSRTFPVKIRVNNEINDSVPLIMPGMYAQVTLPVGKEQEALLAPKDAIVLGGPQPVVFALSQADSPDKPPVVQPIPVQLGVAAGPMIQLIGNLKPGQQVVVEGNERLRPGQAVQVQESASQTAPIAAHK